MKLNLNKIQWFSLLVIIFTIMSCSNKEKTVVKEENKEEKHEETSNITSLSPEQIKTVGITYGTIEMKELTAKIKVSGSLKVPNNNKANATSLYGGVIRTLNVQTGSFVHKGQIIATIANPKFIQLQEEYLTLNSKIIYAEQELQRQKMLNEGDAGAKRNLQTATADISALKTRKASLFQQIQLMGINPNQVSNSNLKSALVVRSPISGTISTVFGKIGSYVDVSSPVVEIVDNSSLHLDLNIFEKDLPLMKVGQTIHFTLTNNPVNEFDAEIFSIGASFENDSKTIPVHCRVKGNKTGLIDGMNITAIVSLNNVLAPAVPNDAVVSSDGKDYIFVITNKKAEEHHEEKEKHNDKNVVNFERIEVVKGISDLGYTVITPINEFPKNAKIVTKGAFFINAKIVNTGGHEH